MRNNHRNNIPSADTVFRRMKNIALESGSHKCIGSQSCKNTVHKGIECISMFIDETVTIAMVNKAFSYPVNAAIDKHDEP